jgi:GAF domain-containing protein
MTTTPENDESTSTVPKGPTERTDTEELRQQLAVAQEHQRATREVLSVISNASADVQSVFDAIARSASRLCEGAAAGVFRYDGDLVHMVSAHAISPDIAAKMAQTYPIRPDRTRLSARAILDGVTVHVPDLPIDPGYPASRSASLGFKSILSVPLIRKSAPIGAINVARTEVGPFSRQQIDLIETFADQAVIAIENVRLFEAERSRSTELTRSLEHQLAISNVLSVISRSPNELQNVLDEIVGSARELCNAEYACIFCLNTDDGKYHVQAASATSTKRLEYAKSNPITADRKSVSGRAVLEKRTIHLVDALNDPELTFAVAVEDQGSSVRLCVPLLINSEVIGVMALIRQELEAFNEPEIEVVETFADQAIIAIENARLFDAEQTRTRELQESLEYQTATGDVLEAIAGSTTDTQPVFDAIVTNAARLCEAEVSAVTIYDGEQVHLAAFNNLNDEAMALQQANYPMQPNRSQIGGRAVLDCEIVQVADVLEDPDYSQKLAQAGKWRSLMGVPLISQGQAIGAIAMAKSKPVPYSKRQVELIATFARQAVIAIENVRLFEAEQQRTHELQESLEYQTAMADVLNVISRSPNELQPVLDKIVEMAARLCEAEMALLHRKSDRGGSFRPAATFGYSSDVVEIYRALDLKPGRGHATGRALFEGKPVQILDVLEDPEYTLNEAQRVGGHRTTLAVPLINDSQTIGIFSLSRKDVRAFTPKQIALVETFADQAVIAIENARLFNETNEALERQTATAEILKVIASSPSDVQPVFDAIVQSAARIFAPCVSGIFMREGDTVNLRGLAGATKVDEEALGKIYPRPFSVNNTTTRAIKSRKIVHIADTEAQSAPQGTKAGARAVGIRSVTAAPLLRGADGIGSINIFSPQAGFQLTEKQISLLQTFADQAVIAIENVRLFNETNEALEQQTAMADVLEVISNSVEDTQPVFDKIIDSCQRLIACSDLTVLTVEADSLVHIGATRGPHGLIASQNYRPAPIEKTIIAQAVLECETVHFSDALNGENVPEVIRRLAAKSGNHSCLIAPLIWQGRPIGALYVVRSFRERQWPPFTNKDISLLETFADQAVIAIQNSRLFNETKEALERQTATANVLQVISRSTFDLDTVLQTLTESAMRLCGADIAVLFQPDGEGNYRPTASKNMPSDFLAALAEKPITVGDGSLTGQALEEKRVMQIENLQTTPSYRSDLAAIANSKTMLSVPLLKDGVPVLALTLARLDTSRAFTDQQIELLTTFGDQAVIAIENTRLFNETKEALEQQKASSEILSVISNSIEDSQPVFEKILDSCQRLIPTSPDHASEAGTNRMI